MHRRAVYVGVAFLVVLASTVLGLALSGGTTPISASTYGPSNTRFVVAFGGRPATRDVNVLQEPNSHLDNMTNLFSLYVARLGANSYESVSIDAYPHQLTTGDVDWFVHDYLFGFHAARWHGLPGAEMDVACHVGDSSQPCPGRIAYRDIISGGVIYELDAQQLSEAEVERFFGSFHFASSTS